MSGRWAQNVFRWVPAAMLAFAAVVKAHDAFTAAAHAPAIASGWAAVPLARTPAVAVPVALIEVAIAGLLVTSAWRVGALGLMAFSLLGLAYLAMLRLSGVPTSSCGCLGAIRVPIGAHAAVLVGFCAVARELLLSPSGEAPQPTRDGRSERVAHVGAPDGTWKPDATGRGGAERGS